MTAVRHVVAVLMLGSATVSAARAADWTIEPVGTSGDLGWRVRTAVDGAGRVYAASYQSGGNTCYSTRSPVSDTWAWPECFDGSFSDLALDLDDRPHLLYRQAEGPKMARLDDNGVWEVIPLPFPSATGLSLVFNSQNLPHISYIDTSAEALKYATWDGADWTITTVTTGPEFRYVNAWTGLALDKNDVPHFLYYEFSSHNLEHAYWNGSGYEFLTIGLGIGWSMVFDEDNNLHVSYVARYTWALTHASFDGSDWSLQLVDSDRAYHGALAFDANGNPHFAYIVDRGSGSFIDELRHAEWTGTTWEIEQIDSWESDVGGPEAEDIVIDDLNHIHVIYTNDSRNLNYATALISSTPGDLDGDGMVGPMDLALLLGNWGPCPDPDNCPADLNLDGSVNADDLAILLSNWR